MNRLPYMDPELRKEYGAPTVEVEKQQKKAAPIYGGGKSKALIDADGFVKGSTLKNGAKKPAAKIKK